MWTWSSIPGVDGELGILPNHIPLVTQIKPGELRVTKGGRDIWLAVGDGFAEITQTKVTVLTDMAAEESAIDEAAAEAAVQRAEKAMREGRSGRRGSCRRAVCPAPLHGPASVEAPPAGPLGLWRSRDYSGSNCSAR